MLCVASSGNREYISPCLPLSHGCIGGAGVTGSRCTNVVAPNPVLHRGADRERSATVSPVHADLGSPTCSFVESPFC